MNLVRAHLTITMIWTRVVLYKNSNFIPNKRADLF